MYLTKLKNHARKVLGPKNIRRSTPISAVEEDPERNSQDATRKPAHPEDGSAQPVGRRNESQGRANSEIVLIIHRSIQHTSARRQSPKTNASISAERDESSCADERNLNIGYDIVHFCLFFFFFFFVGFQILLINYEIN